MLRVERKQIMILWLNCDDNLITYTKKNYLLLAAKRLGYTSENKDSPYTILDLKKRIDEPLEYVLNIDPFSKFVTGTKWTGIWEIDNILDRNELSASNWVCSDTVFIANSPLPAKMLPHKHLAEILFQACDPIIHRLYKNIIPEFDFVFSGSSGNEFHEKRSYYLNLLRSKFSFADYGKDHAPKDYAKLLNSGRIQFVQSGTTSVAPDGYIAQRFFECLAIGPVLTNFHPDLGLLGLVENEDYMVFHNEIELIIKMHLLLEDNALRNKIQANGRKKALLLHTYDLRLISILSKIREHCGQ